MNTFFITTPIYYVNAKPHLGHAYTTIIADTMARYHKLLGEEVHFLTGTDEHGDKIVQAAEKQGITPQEFTDANSAAFGELWSKLGIEYDQFIRTTDNTHKKHVQAILQKVYDAGDIYFGEYGGHYCYGCERFYTEKELENGVCPQHQVKPEFISEKNYFFKMSKYQGWLKEYILNNPTFIRPERYKNEVLGLLDSGALEDLCISRPKSRLTWGIELPFDTEYVCYVWFDALINYISALDGLDSDKLKKFWPAQHLIAKDILKPHAVFWPTMLKAAGLEPYAHLNVHGYWLVRDFKMSKSIGNVLDPLETANEYGLEQFKYFLLREMPFGSDASFSDENITTRINADLANDLGNLFSRVLSMVNKYQNCLVPEAKGTLTEEDKTLQELLFNSCKNYCTLFENTRFSNALESLWELIRALNKYVDSSAPWTLFKENNTERLDTVMALILACLKQVACCLLPVMPNAAKTMFEQLNIDITGKSKEEMTALARIKAYSNATTPAAVPFEFLPAGVTIAGSSSLFPRREVEKAPLKAEKSAPAKEAAVDPAYITFEDFQKVDMRVATVLEAKAHPNADKLLILTIDAGDGTTRQIVSGIAEFYKPEELVQKQVVIVANLAPRKLRGEVSEGMILAVRQDDGLQLVTSTKPVVAGSKLS